MELRTGHGGEYFLGLFSNGQEIDDPSYRRAKIMMLDAPCTYTVRLYFGPASKPWGRIEQIAVFEDRTGGDPIVGPFDINDPQPSVAFSGEMFSIDVAVMRPKPLD